uniref:hypothetical protein n=1 Tax=uncultured Draconibacterium sp. TaxID=1573823 RepID=UPI0032176F94
MKSILFFFFAAFFVVATSNLSAQIKKIRQVQAQHPGTEKINPDLMPVFKIEFEDKTLVPGKGIVFQRTNQNYSIGISDKIILTAEVGIEITGEYPNFKIGLKKHKIGDKYLDGTVFYVDESGMHGLIYCGYYPNTTWSTFQWEYPNGDIDNDEFRNVNTYATGIGAGRYNTMAIMLADDLDLNVVDPGEPYSVAYYIKQNSNDWYVPSYDELKLLYESRQLLGLGFKSEDRIVWSSTEGDYIYKGRSDGPRGEDMPSGWKFDGYSGHKVDLTSSAGKARNGVKCMDFYTGKTLNIAKTYGKTVVFIREF